MSASDPAHSEPAQPRSWLSLLRTARAPAVVLLAAAAPLVLAPQMPDMMAAVDQDARSTLAFHLTLMFLALSTWYWARAALAARFGVDDTPGGRMALDEEASNAVRAAYDWVPRGLFLATLAVALCLLLKSWAPRSLAAVIVWGFLASVILRKRVDWLPSRRHDLPGPQAATREVGAWLRHRVLERAGALLCRAPGGPWLSLPLLVLGVAPLLLGAVESFATLPAGWPGLAWYAARLLPGPAVALAGFGLMIGPLSLAAFAADGLDLTRELGGATVGPRRPPVFLALFLWIFVAVPYWLDVHTVRIAPPGFDPRHDDPRRPLADIFRDWADRCAKSDPVTPVRPIIVAVSGGATRAAVWAAAVLDAVEQARGDAGAGRPAVFAVSSVSGGSLGAAAYMAELGGLETPCSEGYREGSAKAARLAQLKPPRPLYRDALGPLFAGWMFGDIPRAFLSPLAALVRHGEPRGGDSAEAIERGFEQLWLRTIAGSEPAASFTAPFLSLSYPGGKWHSGLPIWLSNGTDTKTGNRLITAPINPAPINPAPTSARATAADWPFWGASDVLTLLHSDVPISTAINNAARFPYLEPYGQLLPPAGGENAGELIDGGYFEDDGIQTALDLAQWLEAMGTPAQPVEPIIVEATADGDARTTDRDVVRCANPGIDPDASAVPPARTLQVLAPVEGLYAVRAGHTAALQRLLAARYCGVAPEQQRYFHFVLPGYRGRTVPLNWILSDALAIAIWGAVHQERLGNAREYERMAAVFRPPSATR